MASVGKREHATYGASVELPLYGVEDWPGQRKVGGSEGISPGERGGPYGTLMAVDVRHNHGDVSITVISHRQRGDDVKELRQRIPNQAIRAAAWEDPDATFRQPRLSPQTERLMALARHDELSWENVTIPIDGHATPFQVHEVKPGWWAAVGRAATVDLALDSRGVPRAGLALFRVTDLPVPRLRVPRHQHPEDHTGT